MAPCAFLSRITTFEDRLQFAVFKEIDKNDILKHHGNSYSITIETN